MVILPKSSETEEESILVPFDKQKASFKLRDPGDIRRPSTLNSWILPASQQVGHSLPQGPPPILWAHLRLAVSLPERLFPQVLGPLVVGFEVPTSHFLFLCCIPRPPCLPVGYDSSFTVHFCTVPRPCMPASSHW